MADKEKPKKVVAEVSEEISESSDNKKATAVEAPKPYIHIDTFLQTAIPLLGVSRIQAAGFKARMNGRHYQTDEQVFLTELKQYLNLK